VRDRLLSKLLWRYYALGFCRNLGFISAVLVPFFTDWGNLSLAQVQLLQSWFMLWIFLLEIPTGVIADRWGRKRSVVIGTIISILGMLIYGLVPRLEIFLVCELLLAFGCACMSGAREAWMYDLLTSCRRTGLADVIFARAQAWNLAGLVVAAPIGSWMAATWGMNTPMLAWGAAQFCTLFFALSLPEKNFTKRNQQSYTTILTKSWAFIRIEPRFFWLTLNLATINISGYFVIWLYQPLLRTYHTPISTFGWYHVLLVVIQIMIMQNYPTQLRLIGSRHRYLIISALFVFIGYLLALFIPNSLGVMGFLCLAGGFGLTRSRIGDAYLAELLPANERASLLSSSAMFGRLLLTIANPVIGYLSDHSLIWALGALTLLPLVTIGLGLFRPIKA